MNNRNSSLSFNFSKEELIAVKKIKELLLPIKTKYNLSSENIINLTEEKINLPISIFNSKLTALESIVKYLKQEKTLSLRKISSLINRDERNIWHILNSANKKYPENFVIDKVKFWIPISIFSENNLPVLELLVSYLKEQLNLTYHEIAVLLSRNDRTIWTVYSRAIKKQKISLNKTSSLSFNFSKEELIVVEKIKELLLPIKTKYSLSSEDLRNLIDEQLQVPISIFNNKLTPLESITKYIKEEKNLSLHEISVAINRNERNIWHIFENSKKKYPEKFVLKDVKLWIPVEIFSDPKLSALEVLVSHLKDKHSLTYREIAALIDRDERTIWTVYSRARKKYVK